jgi:hypothetical protein
VAAKTKNAVFVAAIATLMFASWWAVRLAWAELLYGRNTPASMVRAVALDPANARFRAWQAEIDEHEGRDPEPALRAAAALDPYDSQTAIRLGLRAEFAGDRAAAERRLLEAARIDKLFAPRFTLMNFYYRQGDRERFREWAARSLEMAYGDMTAVFRLCRKGLPEAWAVRQLLPARAPVHEAYVQFLLAEGDAEEAGRAALDLVPLAGAAQAPTLLAACDRLLEMRRGAGAFEIWQALSRRRLIPYRAPGPGQLTNGEFAVAPLGAGFDWRVAADPETTASLLEHGGLLISLSGRQPERCELLWQYVPVEPGRRYRVRCTLHTEVTGLRWDVREAGEGLARVSLVYEREPGTARAQGSVELSQAALEPAP